MRGTDIICIFISASIFRVFRLLFRLKMRSKQKNIVAEVRKSEKNISILEFEIHLYRPYNMTKDIPDYKLLFHNFNFGSFPKK